MSLYFTNLIHVYKTVLIKLTDGECNYSGRPVVPKAQVEAQKEATNNIQSGFEECLPSGRPTAARASLVERHQRSSQS